MDGYRPIPGESGAVNNMPMDDLTRMASESASRLLMPYQDKFGVKPIVPVPGEKTPAPISAPTVATEDRLYESIHPSTFSKVMETIMSLVTGAIPRQAGGPVDPNKEYIVGERGPEKFRPSVPGAIIPTRFSPVDPFRQRDEFAEATEARKKAGVVYDPNKGPLTQPGGLSGALIESGWLGTRPGERPRSEERPIPGDRPIDMRANPETGTYEIPRDLAVSHNRKDIPGFESEPALSHIPGKYPISEAGGWQDYEGGRYKVGPERFFLGGREVPTGTPGAVSGDELALSQIPGRDELTRRYAIPESTKRSYYDTHPEERFMDAAAQSNQELMDMFKTAKTPGTRAAIGRLIEANLPIPGQYYRAGLEYGYGSPATQEKLAHAEYLRRMPGAHLAGISEQGRTHLEGINRQVAGHLGAAKIAAETKDPIMKEIGAILTQGQKMSEMYGGIFDPQQIVSNVLKVYRAMGEISDEQWAKLPDEYKRERWTEQSLRADLKKNGMGDKDIDAYIKRAKTAGKI